MIIIYGIKNCDSVRKARKLFKTLDIEYSLFDFKENSVTQEDIEKWVTLGATVDELFNKRGTTYRTLKLKELNLDDSNKKEWLAKENMLIKRPVIVNGNKITVGYNEAKIEEIIK
jgi:Spx/MgsR family transcriptional regulator